MSSKYGHVGQLNAFHQLRELCVQLRDGMAVPMKEQLVQVREQLKKERERVERLRASSSPSEEASTRAYTGRASPDPAHGPTPDGKAPPRGV